MHQAIATLFLFTFWKVLLVAYRVIYCYLPHLSYSLISICCDAPPTTMPPFANIYSHLPIYISSTSTSPFSASSFILPPFLPSIHPPFSHFISPSLACFLFLAPFSTPSPSLSFAFSLLVPFLSFCWNQSLNTVSHETDGCWQREIEKERETHRDNKRKTAREKEGTGIDT